MLHTCVRYRDVTSAWRLLILSAVAVSILGPSASAQVLVGNPFISSYQGWVDPDPARGANWRISLHNPTIMETANTTPAAPGNPDIATPHTGNYFPMLLVQDGYTSPANYDLNARMYTSDDDLWGLVFGYQDPNNYFRVGFRAQTNGNVGGTSGVSVQKVVNGVITQVTPAGPGTAYTNFPTFTTSDLRSPVDVKVSVTGNNYSVFVAGENGGTALVTGSDADLKAGKIGIQSWAQRNRAAVDPHWGTEVETISVMQGANTLYSGAFNTMPVKWRAMAMTNAGGATVLTTGAGEDRGNFGLDINDRWIYQQTNGFENATLNNTDFIGPGIVVSEMGSTNLTNYQMRVRMGSADNDGYGVIVRAQDDNNFYRVTFHADTAAIGTTRPPRGMSVQKVRNGVWSELYSDDQNNIPFVPSFTAGLTPATGLPMFDVSVGAVGNSLKVQIRDQGGNVYNYPLITDNSDPILSGSVGLHTWGSENTYFTGYAGVDGPLLTTLSEFSSFDVTINRSTGNLMLTNNGAAPVSIRGLTIRSEEGGLNPVNWTPITDHFDEPPPGNGSVDPDDPWTVVSSTALNLSEAEQSGGNGGTIAVGQSINLGNVWVKSQIEDIAVDLELVSGGFSTAAVAYTGTTFGRSDLNTDGAVNASDWPLFYPHMLADLSSLTGVGRALAGDLDFDGDNDVDDFALFKADFDAANGAGAFNAMLANVPEPTAFALLLAGAAGVLCIRRRRHFAVKLPVLAFVVATILGLAGAATATPVDLTTFTVEAFPPTSGFAAPDWVVTPTTATHGVSNQDMSVLYSPDSALNKRYIGSLTPGTDDDVVGFVLGFEPGDAQFGSSADYVLIDWKGVDQNFDFADGDVINFHHSATLGGVMPVGLALSRANGLPTADEFWQHANLPENPLGGVTQLARGATLGSTPYNRSNGSHLFDIRYTASNVTVLVDGVEQFNVDGSFPDGRFGLYAAWQGPQPTFSNFEVVSTDFVGLAATVDRSTGNITLSNPGGSPSEFDFYQLESASGSLSVSGWNSLSDQNFQSVGAGPGQSWNEAGGSNASAIAEVFLRSMSTLAGGASINIGNAYNNIVNGEDLVLKFRLPSGLVLEGAVNYIGMAPVGLVGDYNGNGTVDAADYVLWQENEGTSNSLLNDPIGGTIGQAQYDQWRARFGQQAAGSAAAVASTASVPEPTSSWLAICIGVVGALHRSRSHCA